MSNKWFKRFKDIEKTELIFFCFPHAGGGANTFRKWRELVPSNIDLYSLQLPGREERIAEPPLESMQSIVRNITINIIGYLNKPYVFIGHSLGGIISFEVAKSLRKIGCRSPEHIFIISRESPCMTDQSLGKNSSDADIIKYLKEQSGTSSEILDNQELLDLFLPMIKCDLLIDSDYLNQYIKSEPLACPISAFYGDRELNINPSVLLDWRHETSASFNIEVFSGSHFFLHDNSMIVINRIIETLGIGQ